MQRIDTTKPFWRSARCARRLLIDTTESVAEIAYNCGFNNISNFNRLFKKKKGCTPREFRENSGAVSHASRAGVAAARKRVAARCATRFRQRLSELLARRFHTGPGVAPLPTGRVRVTLLGARTNLCDGDLVVAGPGGGPLWTGYLRHLGESQEVTLAPGAQLDLVPRAVCTEGAPRAPTDRVARVAHPSGTVWDVWWGDYRPDASADYDDLVVRLEALPATP